VPLQDGCVVISAHLDTVFGRNWTCRCRAAGAAGRSGIGGHARACGARHHRRGAGSGPGRDPAAGPVCATVGEEGSGDLRGVRHLLRDPIRPHAFIAWMGPASSASSIARWALAAIGSLSRPGRHSWAAFGVANPAHAVGRAIDRIAAIPALDAPRTAHSVVRLGGGTSLNSIPQEAWFDVDLRSEEPRALERLDAAAHHAVTESWRKRIAGGCPAPRR